eukprot:686899-Hanusia_phi.AAC.3
MSRLQIINAIITLFSVETSLLVLPTIFIHSRMRTRQKKNMGRGSECRYSLTVKSFRDVVFDRLRCPQIDVMALLEAYEEQ